MQRPTASRRPDPVADAPVAALVAASEDLGKRWLIELVAARPLALAVEVPVADFARDGPSACAEVVCALGGVDGLDRLGGAAQLVRRAGGGDPAGAVWAVEALRSAVWAALLDELGRASAELVGDLADRLAYVCASLLSVALGVGDAWLTSIEREAATGAPFGVLLVEIADRPRLAAADLGGELAGVLERAEEALAGRLTPPARLVGELPGRWWVVVPGADRGAARRQGEVLAAALEDRHRGVALACAVGIAVSPDDGQTAAALAERAEDALLAARAAGLGVEPS